MKTEKEKKAIKIISACGIVRPVELEKQGLSRQILYRLYRKGLVVRLAGGVYAGRDYKPTEHYGLIQVCSKVPQGIVCLLSALQFHDITTQMPHQIWIAIDQKARKPRIDAPVRIMYFSGKAFTEGIEIHKIKGVTVKIYCPAKTIADCFKYRNKIGLDIAVEALRDCIQKKRCSIDEIWGYAKICRVANVIRPYLESAI
jgi:predicted transcriptional regulator of viral defense system